MRYLLILVFAATVFAQSPLSVISTATNGSVAIFPIDPGSRGDDIIAMFNTLNSAPYLLPQSQVGLQTTRNGFFANILSITPTTNSTILLVTYQPTGINIPLYTVMLVEQIVEMVYSRYFFASTDTFTSTVPGGILSIFSVDMSLRGEDIHNAFHILNTSSPYKRATSTVGLQTTLAGPFDTPLVNGFIPKVQHIRTAPAPNGTMFIVIYRVGVQDYTIVVAPDQVYGIVYSPT